MIRETLSVAIARFGLAIALATPIAAQWQPISPLVSRVGPYDTALYMGGNWWGTMGSSGLLLLHIGSSQVVFTDSWAPWRLELHVSHVAAVGPPCARGGPFIIGHDWWGGFRLYTSPGDPMVGTPADFWIGDQWGQFLGMAVEAAELNCTHQQQANVIFMLQVDDLRLVPF